MPLVLFQKLHLFVAVTFFLFQTEVEVEVEPEPEPEVEVEVEEPGFVAPEPTIDENGEEVYECPEGYTLVERAGGPICQKSFVQEVKRAGIGTQAYSSLANRGRTGPGQKTKQVRSTRSFAASRR